MVRRELVGVSIGQDESVDFERWYCDCKGYEIKYSASLGS
jgi:hypothetical protein